VGLIADEPLDATTQVEFQMIDKQYKLSEHQYFEFLQRQYQANPFESMGDDDTRYVQKAHNAWVNGQRFHKMLTMMDTYQSMTKQDNIHAVDIGLYPGTWIQLVRHFWQNITWHGVGLCISEDFQSWAKQNNITLCEADIDPFYANDTVARTLPFKDNTLDLVVASEIFEHLISPLVFLQETSRTLKKGGCMLLTTPNVSNIGALIHILKGDSNYERLERSPMFLVEDEWRGHIRFYSKREMTWLASRYGFEVVEHVYYHDDYPISVLRNKNLGAKLSRLIRRFFGLIPHFRGGHVMLLRKL